MSKSKGATKLEDQEAMCRRLAAANDIEVTQVYIDDGISAYTFKDRPGWAQMLADVEAGKLDVLLAQSEDRFSRQPMEKETLAVICAGAGATWLTINDGQLNPATADGNFFSTLRAGLARMESQRKSERQRQNNEEHAGRGLPQRGGKRPFGYLEDKLTLHPDEAPMIAEAYNDLIAGRRTLSRIRTDWNAAGVTTVRGNPWDLPKVEKVLRRPRNAGYVQLRGSYDPAARRGQWETIISEADYAAAVAILDNPARRLKRVTEAKHLCSSIAKCGACGTSMRVAQGGAGVATYRCGVHDGAAHKQPGLKHTSIRCEDLDRVVAEAVCQGVVYADLGEPADAESARLRELHKNLNDIRRAELNLLDLVESGTFSAAEVAAKRLDLRSKVEVAEAEIAAIGQRNARAALLGRLVEVIYHSDERRGLNMRIVGYGPDAIVKVSEVVDFVRKRFFELSLEERRQLVRGMVTVTVGRGRGDGRVKIEHLVARQLNHDPGF